MLVLPADPEFRKAVTLQVPKEYKNADSDWVSFKATIADPSVKSPGWGAEETRDYLNTACYAPLRPHYNNFEIICYPQTKSPVTLELAAEFFKIMLDNNIITPNFELSWAKHKAIEGVHCHIRPGADSSQRVYTALTCYRWVNTAPALVWETVELHRLHLGIPIFPILTHVVAKHIKNWNHSFLTSRLNALKDCVGTPSAAQNPLLGVAAKQYFSTKGALPEPEDRSYLHYVNEAIKKLAAKLTPVAPNTDPNAAPWQKNTGTLKFQAKDPLDTLHPSLFPLYEEPNLSREQADQFLTQLCQKEEPT